MPFRCRQKMRHYCAGSITFSVGVPNEDTGIVEYNEVSQQAKLPDCSMTDLKASLKAGINLQEVNCKLISPDVRSLLDKVVKPAETKSAETKPAETKPAETKPE